MAGCEFVRRYWKKQPLTLGVAKVAANRFVAFKSSRAISPALAQASERVIPARRTCTSKSPLRWAYSKENWSDPLPPISLPPALKSKPPGAGMDAPAIEGL